MKIKTTTYFSSIEPKITVAWKCSNCGWLCSCDGSIYISSSSANRRKAEQALESSWRNRALEVLTDPMTKLGSLTLPNCTCSNCNTEEEWAKATLGKNSGSEDGCLLYLLGLIMFPALFMAIGFLLAWFANPELYEFILYAAAGGLVFSIPLLISSAADKKKRARIRAVPTESQPTIGTNNRELLDYAAGKGVNILSVEQAVMEAAKKANITYVN